MDVKTILEIINTVAAIFAIAISAITLFVYTQRDKRSLLRININSNKLFFSVDLENIGQSPAKIKKIELQKCDSKTESSETTSLITLFGVEKKYTSIIKSSEETPPQGEKGAIPSWNTESRRFSNLSGDIIKGGGTKHHLFRCQASDVNSLKYLWETLKDYEMTITYSDVFGLFSHREQICKSHFQQDFYSFKAALGNRTDFSEKAEMK